MNARLLKPLIILTLCCGVAVNLSADQTWTNMSGGDWNTAGNWSGGAVPGASDNALLTNTVVAGYTVGYSAPMSAANLQNLTVRNASGPVTLNINAGGFIQSAVAGTSIIGTNGTVNLQSGGVWTQAISSFQINDGGVLNVRGGSLTTTNTGTSPYGFTIGESGVGVMTVSNGTAILSAASASASIAIGGSGTRGELWIYNGGNVKVYGPHYALRLGSESFGKVVVAGGTFSVYGSMRLPGGIPVGYSPGGTIVVTDGIFEPSGSAIGSWAGTRGELYLYGGRTQPMGTMDLGSAAGSTGMVLIAGGTYSHTNAGSGYAVIGGEGVGTLIVSNGLFDANLVTLANNAGGVGNIYCYGGTNRVNQSIRMGNLSGATGTLTIAGGTFIATNAYNFDIGYNGRGTLIISNGLLESSKFGVGVNPGSRGDVYCYGGTSRVTSLRICEDFGSTGTLTVAGGTFIATNTTADMNAYLGLRGLGTLIVSDGLFEANNLYVAYIAGSRGDVYCYGGTCRVSGTLVVGNTSGATGTVTMGRGGFVIAGDLTFGDLTFPYDGTVNFGPRFCEMNVKQANYSIPDANADIAAGKITGSPKVRTVQIGGVDYTQLYIVPQGTMVLIQ